MEDACVYWNPGPGPGYTVGCQVDPGIPRVSLPPHSARSRAEISTTQVLHQERTEGGKLEFPTWEY